MPKILWVIDGDEVYGESRAISLLMNGLRSSGWEVEAISLTRGGCYEHLVADGLPVKWLEMHGWPGMHLVTNRLKKIAYGFRLASRQRMVANRVRAHIRTSGAHVVHVLNKNILPGVGWATRREGIPCFWEMTAVVGKGYPFDINRRIYAWLLHRLKIIPLANSRFTAETLGNIGHPVEVMYLSADPERFNPDRNYDVTRKSLGIPANAIVFVIVARIDQRKGQNVFVEALAKVNDPRVHLLLVGGGTSEGDLEQLKDFVAIQSKLLTDTGESRVHFAGFSAEPQAYFAVADVAVNSYLGAEAFGLSVVEAMMMGKPTLVHALGGPAETVIDGATGWHMPTESVESFTAGIRRALADRDQWPMMGKHARERALSLFSLRAQTQRYEKLVRSVLEPGQ